MKKLFFKKRYFFAVYVYDGKFHQICDEVDLIFYISTRNLFIKWLYDNEERLKKEKGTHVVAVNWYVL